MWKILTVRRNPSEGRNPTSEDDPKFDGKRREVIVLELVHKELLTSEGPRFVPTIVYMSDAERETGALVGVFKGGSRQGLSGAGKCKDGECY